jgi:hypothetical protein
MVDLTRPQIEVLISAGAYWETCLEDEIAAGPQVTGARPGTDLATLRRALDKLGSALSGDGSR